MPRDVWIGLIVLGAAALYWLGADAIRISPLDGPVGAGGLPKTLATALGILALILIGRGLMLKRQISSRPAIPAARPAEEETGSDLKKHVRAIGMLALGVFYLLIVPYLGYALSIIALMAAVAVYNGARPSPRLLVTVVLGGIFFYLLFVRFLDIPLPPGMWPDIYRSLQG